MFYYNFYGYYVFIDPGIRANVRHIAEKRKKAEEKVRNLMSHSTCFSYNNGSFSWII